jgi:hypothetical protein
MGLVNVKLDTTKLAAWAEELSARGMRNAIRRAVDQSARAARKQTIPIIAADIGVSKAKIAAAVPKVITTKAGDLAARWTISKLRIGILNVQGAAVSRLGGLSASTHRLTGGGSASLNVGKAFIINANGGRFVAFRRGGSERLPVKAIYAESPATAMGQDRAAARATWQKAANAELSSRLPVEVQKQLVAEGLSAATPDNSD